MVLPGLLGFWLDRRLGSLPLFVLLGVALGMTTAMIHLLRIANPPKTDAPAKTEDSDEPQDREDDDE